MVEPKTKMIVLKVMSCPEMGQSWDIRFDQT